MKRTIPRITSLFAATLMVGCLLMIPAAAATPSDFVSELNGTTSNLAVRVYDNQGNPVAMPCSLPAQGTGHVSIPSGGKAELYDTGNTPFYVESNIYIAFDIRLANPGAIDFWYTVGGHNYVEYTANLASTQHTGSFRTQAGGAMTFTIRNASTYAIEITSIYVG